MLFDGVGIFADTFARLDGKELTLIVPLVECRILIEALVTLQTDQFGPVHCSECFRNFSLADAGFALRATADASG